MAGYSRVGTTGRVYTGESEFVFLPTNRAVMAARRGVVLAHGAGTDYTEWGDGTKLGSLAFADIFASLGYAVVGAELGGQSLMGNDTVVSRIGNAVTLLNTLGCMTDKPILAGISTGVCNALNYARANPGTVAGIIGVGPLCDLQDMYDNNRGGLTAAINTAWSISADPLPTRANPNTTTNAALIAPVPCYLSSSTADTTCPSTTRDSLAAKLTGYGSPVTSVNHSTTLDHSEASWVAATSAPYLAQIQAFLALVAHP